MELYPRATGCHLPTWDHTALPDTRHKWTHPPLPQPQAGTPFTYHGGWVDLGNCSHAKMFTCPETVTHPGVELATCWSRFRRPSQATQAVEDRSIGWRYGISSWSKNLNTLLSAPRCLLLMLVSTPLSIVNRCCSGFPAGLSGGI